MIYRLVSNKIKEFIEVKQKNKNILIVDGVRQVGKTTAINLALKKVSANYLEVNLEKNKLLRAEIDQTKDFLEFERLLKREFNFAAGGKQRVLFIDEANESARLGHYIRQMKEDWQGQTTILSGSMMHRLFRDQSIRIPVGRFENLTVSPFSFSEFLMANEQTPSSLRKYGLFELLQNAKQIENISQAEHALLLSLLDHYLICGGVPEITLNYLHSLSDDEAQRRFFYYLENLKEDFLRVFSQEYANLFDRTITSVANLLGQPYKKTALIQNNNKLADNLLALFENWKFILKLEQKTHQPTHSGSLYPKRYLFDVGLSKHKREMGIPSISFLTTLNSQQREPLGGLIEQFVCQELKPRYPNLCGFRERNYEIDFMIKVGSTVIPIECKASLKPNRNQYRSLDLYHQTYQNKKALIVSLAPFSVVARDGYEIYHVPVYALSCFEELVGF